MKRKVANDELQTLIESIKLSDVVESRVQLIAELVELDVTDELARASLLDALIIFWEDFTCLDISQCALNKTVLHVAAKHLEADTFACLGSFLALGTKASIWCRKHLKMTLMSTEDSQEEEHCSLFFQLLLDVLSYSATTISALTRYPVSSGKDMMVIVEQSISELLNLTKDSVSEIKRFNASGSEVLKAAQVVLNASIHLCKVYCNSMNWDLHDSTTVEDSSMENVEPDNRNHVINITRCTVENLCELGVLAANDGGSLVNLLNLSWKGVVTLLQLGKGNLAVKLRVPDIILTLISLAIGSLRCAAQTWSSSLKETVPVAEAKKIFLPVKFYLINAVRIISHYPIQAQSVYKDITLCILMISTFSISLGMEDLLKSARDILAELLEPTTFHLFNSLLSSAQVKKEDKSQMLDWLFIDETCSDNSSGDPSANLGTVSMEAIFSLNCESMNASRILLIGRVILFHYLLKSAPDLDDDVRLVIARKLVWFLNILTDEIIYSSILVLPVPVAHGSGQTQEVAYQSLYSSILRALKTFLIVVSSTPAWMETEMFLLENLFHPHSLCWEIVVELWCFMVRYSEIDLVHDIIDKLCSLLETVTFEETGFISGSALLRIARSICLVVTCGSQSVVDRVFNFIFNKSESKLSSTMYIALLMEGFPLNSLSDDVKSVAKQRIITEYFDFLETFSETSRQCQYSGFGAPVIALSAALHSLQVTISDAESKTLNLLVGVIRKYNECRDKSEKLQYSILLGETLEVISSVKNLYACDEMEKVILDLENLFISDSTTISDAELFLCKPNLASFMAGLGQVEFEETGSNAKSLAAAWSLFHMLLRERHWAFSLLAITAFGYFSARTSCSELWRFVPPDAALSFDLESGNEASEERFMLEFKVFLEKEMACFKLTPNLEELLLLEKDGLVLKEHVKNIYSVVIDAKCDAEDNTEEIHEDKEQAASKRRKIQDGISKGVELLQSGLKVISNGISLLQQNQFDSAEYNSSLLTHFTGLEDVVANLVVSMVNTE